MGGLLAGVVTCGQRLTWVDTHRSRGRLRVGVSLLERLGTYNVGTLAEGLCPAVGRLVLAEELHQILKRKPRGRQRSQHQHPRRAGNLAPLAVDPHQWVVLAIGFVISFIVALVVVAWFMRWVRTKGFAPFAIYRIALAIVLIILLMRGSI